MVKTSPLSVGSRGSIPGQVRAKIPHATQAKNKNRKQKQYCNKFNKDFKNGPLQKKKKILKKESREEVRGKALFKQRPKGEGHGSGETLWGDGLTCKGSGV